MGDGLEVNFGFAAAGDAVQENDARFFGGDFLAHDGEGGGLAGVGQARLGLGDGSVLVRVAVLGAGFDGDELALGEGRSRRRS